MLRKSLVLFLLFHGLCATAQESNLSVGFRVGEPLGLSVRKYIKYYHAFDLNIGTYGFLLRQNVSYKKGRYETPGLAIQGHYLYVKHSKKNDDIWAYLGYGGQVNNRLHRDSDNIAIKKVSVGPSGVAGLEFKIPNDKLSIFLDTGLYVELLPAPFFYNPSVGAGVRYNVSK